MKKTEYPKKINPFTAIWTRPRETVRYVIEEKSSGFIFLLIVLAGFAGGLFSSFNSEQLFPVVGLVLLSLFFGPIGAAVSTAIGAGVYVVVGKLFKGKSSFTEMFRAILTGQITQIWLIPLILLWMVLLPETYFLQPGELPFQDSGVLTLVFILILGIVSIWTLVIQCKAVGEAHKLSAWKGFFIILIPVVLFIIVISAIIAVIATAVM